jgi:HEAT repeat protein
MLPELKEVLFTGDLYGHSNMRENLILSLQQIDWHLSLPLAAEALQLPLPDFRTIAAEAIQNLRLATPRSKPNELSDPATTVLLTALHDPDPKVVFAVMQSLGNLNGRPDERPKSTVQHEQWTECLRFWESFQRGPN